MINDLSISFKNNFLKYPEKIVNLFENKKFKFTKGLNIIVGPNGSGKSTLIDAFKYDSHTLTSPLKIKSIQDTFEITVNKYKDIQEDKIINADELITVGKSHNDFDIFSKPNNFQQFFDSFDLSEGQSRILAIQKIIKQVIQFNKEKKSVVILFDEPTLYLSIEREIDFFKTIEKLSEKIQIIIATNSTFCFGLNANYIELEKNYILSQTKLLNGYFKKLSDNLQLKLLGLTKEELISMIKKYSGRKVDIDGQNYLICDNMPIIGETKCILLSWEYLDKIELIYFLCNLINKYNNVQEL